MVSIHAPRAGRDCPTLLTPKQRALTTISANHPRQRQTRHKLKPDHPPKLAFLYNNIYPSPRTSRQNAARFRSASSHNQRPLRVVGGFAPTCSTRPSSCPQKIEPQAVVLLLDLLNQSARSCVHCAASTRHSNTEFCTRCP